MDADGNADLTYTWNQEQLDGQLPIFRRKWNRSDESV